MAATLQTVQQRQRRIEELREERDAAIRQVEALIPQIQSNPNLTEQGKADALAKVRAGVATIQAEAAPQIEAAVTAFTQAKQEARQALARHASDTATLDDITTTVDAVLLLVRRLDRQEAIARWSARLDVVPITALVEEADTAAARGEWHTLSALQEALSRRPDRNPIAGPPDERAAWRRVESHLEAAEEALTTADQRAARADLAAVEALTVPGERSSEADIRRRFSGAFAGNGEGYASAAPPVVTPNPGIAVRA